MSDPAPAPAAAPSVIFFSQRKFVLISVVVAGAIYALGRSTAMPVWLLAAEVFATIL